MITSQFACIRSLVKLSNPTTWRRPLNLSQLCDCISNSQCQGFDGLNTPACGFAQVFAKQQLRLPDYACQWIVYLVSDVGHKIGDLNQFCFVFVKRCFEAGFGVIVWLL